MYKCCLCGKEYLTESAVVKCVNRCGREMSRKGIFQPKEAPYSEGTTTVDFGFNIEKDNIKEQIVAALDTLYVKRQKKRTHPKICALFLNRRST